MWTKLNSTSRRGPVALDNQVVQQALEAAWIRRDLAASCVLIASGASNLTFLASQQGETSIVRFFGTGAVAQAEALAEAEILTVCFAEHCEVQSIGVAEQDFALLEMTLLESAKPSPREVFELQQNFDAQLRGADLESLFDSRRDVLTLVGLADQALTRMVSDGLIGTDQNNLARSLMADLATDLAIAKRVPCHGDLSPKNLLTVEGRSLVAIDWEDRLWGVQDYDFLYWLTFMENREYLSRESLEFVSLPLETSIALLLVIVVLKESLNVSANKVSVGRTPVATRLGWVLGLLE